MGPLCATKEDITPILVKEAGARKARAQCSRQGVRLPRRGHSWQDGSAEGFVDGERTNEGCCLKMHSCSSSLKT